MSHDPELLQRVLDCPMEPNDADARTVREYIVALASAVWQDGEGFSGKRPFGTSGWDWDIYEALSSAGLALEDDPDWNGPTHQLVTAAIETLA